MKEVKSGDGSRLEPGQEHPDASPMDGIGPADLREYIDRIERAGELKRITAEVDLGRGDVRNRLSGSP